MPNEVFVSHSSHDRTFVERLVSVLCRHGIPLWYSQTNILGHRCGTTKSDRRSGVATGSCSYSPPGAVTSQWVKRELLYSLQESRYEGRIVPLMYEPCPYDELSWTLASMQMVDFTNGFDPGCRDLLRT